MHLLYCLVMTHLKSSKLSPAVICSSNTSTRLSTLFFINGAIYNIVIINTVCIVHVSSHNNIEGQKRKHTIFIFEEEKVGERICRFIFQVSPLSVSRSPLDPFGRILASVSFTMKPIAWLSSKYEHYPNLMVHEVVEIFHHYLLEHFQVSN